MRRPDGGWMVDADPPIPDFTADEADAVLARFWDELRGDPALAPLAVLAPSDRALTLFDLMPLIPVAMPLLGSPADQLRMLDAAVHAYARARGLHFMEE